MARQLLPEQGKGETVPIHYRARMLGRLGSLLVSLSLIGGCGLANPAEAPGTATTSSPVGVTHASPPLTSLASTEPVPPETKAVVETVATPSGTSDSNDFPEPVDFRTRPVDGMVMVYVPGGTFPMGSTEKEPEANADEMPRHMVTLDAFWIDRTEVTNAQFVEFLNQHGKNSPQGTRMIALDEGYTQISQEGDEFVTTKAALDRPVVMVTWHGAAAYCRWAGGRLPTEAEWEYAARGPEGNPYPWGSEPPSCDLANHGTCVGVPVNVGSRPAGASWCGALDMAGNVWEWVGDWFGPYQDLPQANPTGPATGEVPVLRGGGWHSPRRELRATYRHHEIRAIGFNG
jgi:serine/threonine-protein kinase